MPRKARPLIERFFENVSPEPNSGCWLWTGQISPQGYGRIKLANPRRDGRAHRVGYELLCEPVPIEFHMDHLCRVRCCVNPDHLEPVTPKQNSERGEAGLATAALQKAKTHCPNGHPYAGDNLIEMMVDGYSARKCRTCVREHNKINARRYRQEAKEAA